MAVVPSIGRASRLEPSAPPEAERTRDLYERYAGQIFSYCLHQLGSREEAEDAVQSTFLNAFRGLKRGVVPELESAWLFKIAQNVCLSRRRSSWRRGRIESPADFEIVEELAPAPSRRGDELIGLQDVLERMPESQRRAILLREWQGLSYREIADELELSQAAVETLIFRARRTLAQGLEQPTERRRGRIRHGSDLGNLLAGLKSFLLGGGAAAKVAATVAVVSATTVVAAAPVQQHRPPAAPPAAGPKHDTTSASRPSAPAGGVAPVLAPERRTQAPRLHEHAAAVVPAVSGARLGESPTAPRADTTAPPAAALPTTEAPAASAPSAGGTDAPAAGDHRGRQGAGGQAPAARKGGGAPPAQADHGSQTEHGSQGSSQGGSQDSHGASGGHGAQTHGVQTEHGGFQPERGNPTQGDGKPASVDGGSLQPGLVNPAPLGNGAAGAPGDRQSTTAPIETTATDTTASTTPTAETPPAASPPSASGASDRSSGAPDSRHAGGSG